MEPKRLNIGTHEARLQPVSAADIEALMPLARRLEGFGARPGLARRHQQRHRQRSQAEHDPAGNQRREKA